MSGRLVLLWAAITYVAPNQDKRRPFALVPRIADRRVYTGNIVSVRYPLDVPPVRHEARGDVLGYTEVGVSFDANIIVVIEIDQLSQSGDVPRRKQPRKRPLP